MLKTELEFESEKTKQTIYRVIKNKETPYVMMNKTFFEDPSISMRAKGVLGYLLTKPNDWKVYRSDIVNHCTDGKASIESALAELKKAGYLKISAERDKNGRVSGWVTYVFELPTSSEVDLPHFEAPKSPEPDLPDLVNPHSGFTRSGKSAPTNNNYLLNTNLLENNNNKTHTKNFDAEFEEFWAINPKQVDKIKARKVFNELLSKDYDNFQKIMDGRRAQNIVIEHEGTEKRFIKGPASWLSNRRFNDVVQTKEQLYEERERSIRTANRPTKMSRADQEHSINARIRENAERQLRELTEEIARFEGEAREGKNSSLGYQDL